MGISYAIEEVYLSTLVTFMNTEKIEVALKKLQHYIETENYCGYDPYDLLKSPLFRLPFLNNKWIRFAAQQFGKRFPFNIRPLLLVPKGTNPVTQGLCIQAYSSLIEIYPGRKKIFEEKILQHIDELEKLIPKGFHGACWGYDFDWEARYVRIPAYQPTIVATGIITHALFKAFRVTENKKAFDLCESAVNFVLQEINRSYDQEKNFCFSYSPFDKLTVFNASMKGIRLLAQVYSITKNESLKENAHKGVAFVMNHQRDDGAWVYSTAKTGQWIDNYHTGYILDCLDEYMKCTGDRSFELNLQKGFQFYRKNFFTEDLLPKFYDKNRYPLDCTSAAQSILTLVRFDHWQGAAVAAVRVIKSMQDKKGYFYFRRFKNYTIKTSFMRWSNAWMFAALSELLHELKKKEK